MKAVLAALSLLVVVTPAAARDRSVALHPECNVTMPCEGAYPHPRGVRIAAKMPFGAPVMRYRTEQPRKAVPTVRTVKRTGDLARTGEGRRAALDRPRPSKSLDGVVPVLAEKVREIVSTCGSEIWSTVRHTLVAGTRLLSQHAGGTAVDLHGNPSCIYALLKDWPGGYSTDYGRVRHVHVSYGGREHGARFAHGGGRYVRRYARANRHRLASAAR